MLTVLANVVNKKGEIMPRDKSATYQKILLAAKQEFLEKGFEQASMRSIASKVGMSAAGLYRHFSDKEAAFTALVKPALESVKEWYKEHKARDYNFLENNELDAMWETSADIKMMIDVVYPHFDEFKLLLCCSEGTKYDNCLHDFVMIEQSETQEFLAFAKKKGFPVKDIEPKALHLLLSAYVTSLFEVVVHDFSIEEAKDYLSTLKDFFYPGWRKVLGL